MSPDTVTKAPDGARLRDFWNRRYADFTLSESGWSGAGEGLNDLLYACKRQALRRSLAAAGLTRDRGFSVLDGGCGQGHFARFYQREYPASSYVGLDISERAVDYLRKTIADAEFHVADLCTADAPLGDRTFDVVQIIDVMYLMLDDDGVRRALANLAQRLAPGGLLLMNAALPEQTVQRSDYLRYRSRAFWRDAIAALGLRIVAERPMYYWLPAGPENRMARYAMARLGPRVLYAADRAALALRLPRPELADIDSRMRLLSLQRA